MGEAKVKLRQFQQESDAWKRMLVFLSDENSTLKTRLAEVVKDDGINPEFLSNAELYQNKFMQKDEIISLIRQDITGIDKLLIKELYKDKAAKEVIHKQKILRRELKKLATSFNEMKFHFNNYLAEHL